MAVSYTHLDVYKRQLLPFLEKVKERFPEKTIWCFTGYVFEKDILNRMIPKWKYTKKMLEPVSYTHLFNASRREDV